MATELAERPQAKDGVLMSVTDATIADMSIKYGTLKINGIEDKAGYLACDTARKDCVKARGVIKKEHAELKEESLRIGQALDKAKRELTAKIETIENRLISELEAVEAEKNRLRKVAEDKLHAERLEMLKPFAHAGSIQPSREVIMAMNPEQWKTCLENVRRDKERREEQEKELAKQEEVNRIEAAKLAAERAELDRVRKEQEAAQAAIVAEQNRLAKIEVDRLNAEEIERCKVQAAERARVETEERLEREAKTKEAQRVAEIAAAKRAEELKPARDRLLKFADDVLRLEIPDISVEIDPKLQAIMNGCAGLIRALGKELA